MNKITVVCISCNKEVQILDLPHNGPHHHVCRSCVVESVAKMRGISIEQADEEWFPEFR